MPGRISGYIANLVNRADKSLDLADATLLEVLDGVTLELTSEGEESLWDFFMGKTKVCPVKVRLLLKEKDDG